MRENLLPALIGIVLFALYAGYLAVKIGAAPLMVIVGAVLAMTVVDFVRSVRD
jgi:hypothetical protein